MSDDLIERAAKHVAGLNGHSDDWERHMEEAADYVNFVRAERDALLVQRNDAMAAVSRAVDMKIAAEAERDELRELLREARESIYDTGMQEELVASIDAALKERQP